MRGFVPRTWIEFIPRTDCLINIMIKVQQKYKSSRWHWVQASNPPCRICNFIMFDKKESIERMSYRTYTLLTEFDMGHLSVMKWPICIVCHEEFLSYTRLISVDRAHARYDHKRNFNNKCQKVIHKGKEYFPSPYGEMSCCLVFLGDEKKVWAKFLIRYQFMNEKNTIQQLSTQMDSYLAKLPLEIVGQIIKQLCKMHGLSSIELS